MPLIYALTMGGLMTARRAQMMDTRQALSAVHSMQADIKQSISSQHTRLADLKQSLSSLHSLQPDTMVMLSEAFEVEADTQQVLVYFMVRADGAIDPLGVMLKLKEAKLELLPKRREYIDEIPGRHGELQMGAEYETRTIELPVFAPGEVGSVESIKRAIVKHLGYLRGTLPLMFAWSQDRVYYVRLASGLDLKQHPNWLELTLPLKMPDPFAYAPIPKRHTGSGILTNDGDVDTPIVIGIRGPVTDPQLQIGDRSYSFTGTLASTDLVTVDTDACTVTFNGVNALERWSGGFPKLAPGQTAVVVGDNVTVTWRERYLI